MWLMTKTAAQNSSLQEQKLVGEFRGVQEERKIVMIKTWSMKQLFQMQNLETRVSAFNDSREEGDNGPNLHYT